MRVLRVLRKQQVLLNALCLLKMTGHFDTSIIYQCDGDGDSKSYSDVVAHDPYHKK